MSAKAFLAPKPNSFNFDDRLLELDSPAKIGRSHKDDRSESGNGYFDCKVLSRSHAMIMFDEGKFFLLDTGSSNGSFVNNIRLSKCGEESKITQIYTGDLIRFGSDVVDKAKNVTQKCIVAKIKLYFPDGIDCESRPAQSRLFRPQDSFEDIHTITASLQESLAREKMLEDKLVKVKGMTEKHIGRSQSDMVRLFDGIKQELTNMFEEREAIVANADTDELEKVLCEKKELGRRLADIENQLADRELFCSSVAMKQERDGTEITKLRLLVDTQNNDIANLENALNDTQNELDRSQGVSLENQDFVSEEAERKVQAISRKAETDLNDIKQGYEIKFKDIEDSFSADQAKMKQQLHDVTTNEINLLNRIKSLESESGYAQAEVDKIVVKDADQFEYKQELEYKVQCLSTELNHCRMQLEDAEVNKVIERSEDDIRAIEEQGENIVKLKEEVAYIKKELIDSRSRKAAAEDELNTVKGTVETITNSSKALSNEIEALNETVKLLTKNLQEETIRANHLEGLVLAMESEPGIDAKSKVEIGDLKCELAASQVDVKARIEEIFAVKDQVRQEQETVQQKEIEISRLNGQVQFIEEEMEQLKLEGGDLSSLQAEINSLRNKLKLVVDDLEVTRGDNVKLSNELQQQQILYSELKKMRGRGEELDLLEQAQRDVVDARDMAEEYHGYWQESKAELGKLGEEKIRVLRENAQLRSSKTVESLETVSTPVSTSSSSAPIASVAASKSMAAGEAVMANIGSLKLYEILLGLLFISVIISWNPYTLPL
eukprot:GFUD01015811.1.p1 GENE.GFUD01015811.1~~GFUD01015811.1.p1  ORF type:complete len:777 (-),score=220.64 GFUD01015811.1:932-3262(-)